MLTSVYDNTRRWILVPCLALLLSGLIGCDKTERKGTAKTPASYPGTEAGAKMLLKEYLQPGGDYAAMTKSLRPTDKDYEAVFQGDFAGAAKKTYTPPWDAGVMKVAPKEGQTELLLWSATSEDLKKWNEKAKPFPGGYKEVASRFKDGLTIYRFKFVKPGEKLGMAYDGLIHVNGHWRLFPKPWRIK